MDASMKEIGDEMKYIDRLDWTAILIFGGMIASMVALAIVFLPFNTFTVIGFGVVIFLVCYWTRIWSDFMGGPP
jgi:uncharacterized membrane protein